MANFKLGVCTWTFGDQSLSLTAARLASLGFDGVELAGDLRRYSAAEAGKILGDNGLEVFSLTPDNVDIAHPDTTIRQSALDYFFRLIDFAAELGRPLVSCHGLVGRVAPVTTMQEENDLLVGAVRQIGERAREYMLRVVFEVLNRYETHQIHTGTQALALIEAVGLENVGVLLDAYHMNIEEAEPSAAIRGAGPHLWLYHVGDSNRQAVGRGHTDFSAQVRALQEIGYNGPVIMECMAPGPNPFTPDKGEGWRNTLESFLTESRTWFQNN
jgi:sugar phosphate isomerase/epimerase